MPSVKVSEETHVDLTKILGELMAQDGKKKTFDDTIKELIRFWKDRHG